MWVEFLVELVFWGLEESDGCVVDVLSELGGVVVF